MIRIIIEIDTNNVSVNRIELPSKSNEKIKLQKITEKKKVKSKQITIKERKCETCGNSFSPSGNRQKYCSEECGLKPKKRTYTLKEDIPTTYSHANGELNLING